MEVLLLLSFRSQIQLCRVFSTQPHLKRLFFAKESKKAVLQDWPPCHESH